MTSGYGLNCVQTAGPGILCMYQVQCMNYRVCPSCRFCVIASLGISNVYAWLDRTEIDRKLLFFVFFFRPTNLEFIRKTLCAFINSRLSGDGMAHNVPFKCVFSIFTFIRIIFWTVLHAIWELSNPDRAIIFSFK